MCWSCRFALGFVAVLLFGGCTNGFIAPRVSPPPMMGQITNDEIWLMPVYNPDLVLEMPGTVGPLLGSNSLDRGFGQYDGELQSSLYLCAATGPVAGPCLAVLGGLFALAGASASLVEDANRGSTGETATAAARATLSDDPQLSSLSARISENTVALAQRLKDPIRLSATSPGTACIAGAGAEVPRAVASLDIVEIKTTFEPGYQFRLTVVCRVRTQYCASDRPPVERRLAYLGGSTSMSKDPARAEHALRAAVGVAIANLGEYTHAYLRNALLGLH